jgi:hypothetical protein
MRTVKTFYLYKANFNTTVFGFESLEEALDDIFEQGYKDEVEIQSYRASHGYVEDDERKNLKVVITPRDMNDLFTQLRAERDRLAKSLVKRHAKK